MKTKFQPVKGMQDFYPEDYKFIKWFRETWNKLGEEFGYKEYDGPILETLELYTNKTSEEIVNSQTYSLNDRNNRALILRPELTPTLARMVAAKEYQLSYPLRMQSFGQFFRYEQPQKGRSRSFYQWNVDLIGSESIFSDIEILKIALQCLFRLGLDKKQLKIKINNRKIFQRELSKSLDIPFENVSEILRIIDKIDKLSNDKIERLFYDIGLLKKQIITIFDFIESDSIYSNPWFKTIFDLLKINNIDKYFEIDLKIIRGFDYYTGIVFEAWAEKGLNRSLFGGGRYDNLVQQVGGSRQLPGIGFAVGSVPVFELLKEQNLLPSFNKTTTDVMITIFSDKYVTEAIECENKLREYGYNVEIYPCEKTSLKKQLKYASKNFIPYIAFIGEDEIINGNVKFKNLTTGKESVISKTQIKDFKSIL